MTGLTAIGLVRSDIAAPADAPRQGRLRQGLAHIELDQQWAGGLEGLEPGRWVWVLWRFITSEPPRLRVHPRGDPDRPATGLFNTRAPVRPNPIALTLARIEALDGGRLTVSGLEAADGTEVLDLKPYFAELDAPAQEGS